MIVAALVALSARTAEWDRPPAVAAIAHALVAVAFLLPPWVSAEPVYAQTPVEGEVRQLVTFRFLPGRAGEGLEVLRERAVPFYERDEAMLSFRAFREIESSVPLDLIVVRGFRGMRGMDASGERLRELAAEKGTSMGAFYERMGAILAAHTDEFVEMLPDLGAGDPSASPRTALVWYRVAPGGRAAFERAVAELAAWETDRGLASSTGRFLLSGGWHYLRFLGFDALGDYQEYWSAVASAPAHDRVEELTVVRREVIVSSVPDLAIR